MSSCSNLPEGLHKGLERGAATSSYYCQMPKLVLVGHILSSKPASRPLLIQYHSNMQQQQQHTAHAQTST